jgi:hypothetical protein
MKNNYPTLTRKEAVDIATEALGTLTITQLGAVHLAADWPLKAVFCEIAKELYGTLVPVAGVEVARREIARKLGTVNHGNPRRPSFYSPPQAAIDAVNVVLEARADRNAHA